MTLLTVIVPVYNEAATINALLCRLQHGPYPDKQIVVVNDGSTDRTERILENWSRVHGVIVLNHPRNCGKGAAIRTALRLASSEITLIQDADLEYDPNDFPLLVEPIRSGECDVVYGSRYLNSGSSLPWNKYRIAVNGLNLLVGVLYGQCLTDEATCYKAFRTEVLRNLDLRAQRFEFCPEVTAKVLRTGRRIVEVPVRYTPRSIAEGKKIGWRDGWYAVWTLVAWRFRSFPGKRNTRSSRLFRFQENG